MKKGNADSVKLGQTVDTTKTREAPLISDKEFDEHLDRFVVWMHRPPLPHEKPSVHQLSAVLQLIRTGTCYVDFALMGPHHVRTMKAWRWLAKVWINGEVSEWAVKGPPDYASWEACWNVFQTCLIMAGACILPHLIAYAATA